MKNVKMLALAAATTAALSAGSVQAEQFYGFSNVSVNYLDWSDGTTERTGGYKEDFVYLEVEGGAGYDWGDVYGFVDFENPTKGEWRKADETVKEKAEAFRIAAKGSVAINMGDSNFNYYGQLYSLSDSSGFYEQNVTLGVSYDYNTDFGLWVKPFIGAHYVHNNFIGAGFNGYMGGWVLGYNFELAGQSMMITNWNEIEFDRADEYKGANGNGTGLNGAVALWWTPTPKFTAGVQYRYADHKLGAATYQNAVIFSAKYNF
ncbi:ion channel protein Tsx [Shewanella sp. NIFS-20-20]|nr:ion channel protein Tsx [Shewanella sp. NIFS-20-20]